MATKRGEKPKHELANLAKVKKEDEYIERLVLPSDSVASIALLYNTSIAEIKKLNNLHKDADLHARRIVKVPSRGILVDLTESPRVPLVSPATSSNSYYENENEESDGDESSSGHVYLTNVDTTLKEIKERAETVLAKSVVLQAPDSESITLLKTRSDAMNVRWWIPLLLLLVLFVVLPYLYYLEILEYLNNHNHTGNNSSISENIHSELHDH